MWRKIRSTFILKKIFYNINEKNKFRIVVYNKKIQIKLGLNIINFIRYSGKYKIESNGEIKIFNSYNEKLLFKGFYSNNKKMDLEKNIILRAN